MLRFTVLLATVGAASAFAPAVSPLSQHLRSSRTSPMILTMNGVQSSVDASGRSGLSSLKFTRKEAVSTIAAAITFGFTQSSVFAEEKAACTYASCPPPPADAVYELSLFQVASALIRLEAASSHAQPSFVSTGSPEQVHWQRYMPFSRPDRSGKFCQNCISNGERSLLIYSCCSRLIYTYV
jgi:hypothetical protein